MNYFLKIILIVISVILVIALLFSLFLQYMFEWYLTDIAQFRDPETGYTVTFQEKGSAFLFGNSTVVVRLRSERGKVLDSFTASISNDGATLDADNIRVVWRGDSVEVTLLGSEQAPEIYILQFGTAT